MAFNYVVYYNFMRFFQALYWICMIQIQRIKIYRILELHAPDNVGLCATKSDKGVYCVNKHQMTQIVCRTSYYHSENKRICISWVCVNKTRSILIVFFQVGEQTNGSKPPRERSIKRNVSKDSLLWGWKTKRRGDEERESVSVKYTV